MHEVLIFGGGIAGLTLAKSLKLRGIEPLVINKLKYDIRLGIRTITLSEGSRKIYEKIGIRIPDCGKISAIETSQINEDLNLVFEASEINEEHMGHVVGFNDLISTLIDSCKQSMIDILCEISIDGISFDDQGLTVKLSNGRIVSPKLIFFSDGADSCFSKFFPDLAKHIKYYHSEAAMFNINHSKPHFNTAIERFTKNGPIALLPLQDQNASSVVWSQNDNIAFLTKRINKDKLSDILSSYLPKWLGDVSISSDIIRFPLSMQLSYPVYKNRCFLIGNSARIVHPVAGQGFNIIMRDIEVISDVLSQSNLNDRQSVDFAYKAWVKRRMSDWIRMTIFTDSIVESYNSDNFLIKKARNMAFAAFRNIGFLRKKNIEYATNG